MTRRNFATGALMVAALMASSCSAGGKRFPDYRYRLTVEVDTPEGVKTGSSVNEVHMVRAGQNAVPLPRGVGVSLRGEAVAVDLGRGQTLFALLRSESSLDWASWIMLWLTRAPTYREGHDQLSERVDAMLINRQIIEIPARFTRHFGSGPGGEDARPILVRFANIADSRTVEKVDPDDLAASFGPGVRLRRITAQLTEDQVTTGLKSQLTWLGNFQEPRLDPAYEGGTHPNFAQTLSHGDFSAGVNQ